MFIVFDGTDGSGKATQSRLLMQTLEERDIASTLFEFPQYRDSIGGKLLAKCLAGLRGDFVGMHPELASLPYALDRFEASEEIRKALADHKVVVADRYTSSNQIHQGGKLPEHEREAYLKWLHELEHVRLKSPEPDMVMYLRAPVEVSMRMLAYKRASKGGLLEDGELDQVESDRQYLENSHRMADWLAARYEQWHIIECADEHGNMRSREEIHVMVCDIVLPLLDIAR